MNTSMHLLISGRTVLLSLACLFVIGGLFSPLPAEAAIQVWNGPVDVGGLRGPTYAPYAFPAWTRCAGWPMQTCTTYPAGMATGLDFTYVVETAASTAYATNPDSQNWNSYPTLTGASVAVHPWHGGSDTNQSSNRTGGKVCSLIDSTSTATWTTGSYNSPEDNKLIRYGQVAPGNIWQRANADNTGNSYIKDLICTTSALPANTLSAAPTSITAGESSTITFDAGPNSEAQGTICTAVNFSVPTHEEYKFGTYLYDDTPCFTFEGGASCPNYSTYAAAPTGNMIPDTSGSVTVSPTVTTTYQYNCTNANGTTNRSVTVTVLPVVPPAATATLSANPTSITSGGSATLTWSSTDATSCTSGNFATGGATSGSVSVSPTTTTTYSMSCTGAGGTSAMQYATVTVSGQPDLSSGTVSPTTATADSATTLSMVVSNNGTASTGVGFTNRFDIDADADHSTVTTTVTGTSPTLAASGTNTSTASYTFTAGTWYVRACADSGNAVAEGNESNNCGAWTTVTASPPAGPNLTAGAITPTSATSGTAVTLSSTITNSGSASTQSTFWNLFQIANDASGAGATSIGTSIDTGKAAGQSGASTLSYTFTAAGTKYVRACADNNASMVGTIAETNEGDNCGAWTAVTISAPLLPDVTAGAITPTTATTGTAVTFSSMVSNTGNASTGTTFTDVFQIANDASGTGATVIGTFTNPTRAAGTSGAATVSYTFSSAGTWYVRACADNNASMAGTINESNEGNNCGAWTAVTAAAPAAPNLSAGAITPTAATTGTAVTLSSTITNSGNASTQSTFWNLFQIANDASGAGATSIGTSIDTGKTAGQSGASTLSYTFTSSGTKYVRVCADNNASMVGTIPESNESDNCGAWTAVVVTDPPMPNLRAGLVTPATATVGSSVVLSSTITNNGNASTGTTFTDVFQVADNDSGIGATVIGTFTNPTRAAGTSGAATLSYTFTTPGAKYVRVCADNNASFVGTIAESDEGDNCSTWSPVYVNGPNLVAGAVTPTTANVGTAVTLSVTVTNNGSASTGTTFTDVFQVANDASGTGAAVIGTFTNPIRTAGTSGAATLSYTFTTGGAKYVRVCADNNASFVGTISETNESDNCGAWTLVTVNGPDLVASAPTPTSAVAGTAVTFTSTINNSGSLSTGTTFTDLFQVASDSSGTNAVDIGTYANPVRAAGTSNTATVSYTFTTPGTRYVRACADKSSAANNGSISESNESNNCSSWTEVTVTSPTTGPNLMGSGVTPTTATAGTSATLSSTISNIGTGATGTGFTNLFQFDNDSDHTSVTDTRTDTSPVVAAGSSDASSVNYTFSAGGTWYVRVCADTDTSFAGVIIETSETDNCSAWTSVSVSGPSGANLVAGTVSPSSATAGTPATFSSAVTNNGLSSTGAGFTNLFQFDNNADHSTITSTLTDASPTLGSGLTDTSSVSMNFPTAGTWYVRACADNNASFVGSIVESNEADNCSGWTPVNVANATAGANLTTGTVSPTTAVVGTAATLSALVSNGGTAGTVYSFTNLFQIDADANHDTITASQTDTSPVLAAGGSDTTTSGYTFGSVGTWYVRVCADNNTQFTGVVTESDESDNCGPWTPITVTAAAGPNLTAGAITPITATAGTAVALRSTITNAGSASTVTTFNNVYQTATDASGTGATVIGTYLSPIRGAGTSVSASYTHTFSTAGTWYVRLCSDNNASFVGTIAESNENDNCGPWTPVNVAGGTPGADLTAGTITPNTAVAGASVTYSSTMTNAGTASTGTGFTTLFQFDDLDHVNNGIVAVQTDAVSALAPSGTEVSTVTYAFQTAGTWYVRACADNDASFAGSITETNEANNCSGWRAITVTTPTGAGVTSCTVSPGSVATGTPVTWTASPSGLGTYTWAPSEGGAPGGTGASLNRSYANAGTYGMSVTAGGGTANCPNVIVGASEFGTAEPTITTSPERVVPGSTTNITVSATGVDVSCQLTGPGVSRTFTPVAGVVAQTTVTTSAINNQSTYTFTCDDVEATAKAIVNIIPVVQEF